MSDVVLRAFFFPLAHDLTPQHLTILLLRLLIIVIGLFLFKPTPITAFQIEFISYSDYIMSLCIAFSFIDNQLWQPQLLVPFKPIGERLDRITV
jgi:hypothetical protein